MYVPPTVVGEAGGLGSEGGSEGLGEGGGGGGDGKAASAGEGDVLEWDGGVGVVEGAEGVEGEEESAAEGGWGHFDRRWGRRRSEWGGWGGRGVGGARAFCGLWFSFCVCVLSS